MLPGWGDDVAGSTPRGRVYLATETGLFSAQLDTAPLLAAGLESPLPSLPHAIACGCDIVALASPHGVAVFDETWALATWLADAVVEPVALAISDGDDEIACSLGTTMVRLIVRRFPLSLTLSTLHHLDVYPWALAYEGATLWLACGDGGLWRAAPASAPSPVDLVPFAASVAVSGPRVACTTSAEVVLIDTADDPRVIARRRLRGDVMACAFHRGQLIVATGASLVILDPESTVLDELGVVPLPFPPAALCPIAGGVVVVGVQGASLVTDHRISDWRNS